MAKKEDGERFSGEVTEVLPDQQFRVKLDENSKEVLAHLCGKMRQNKIKVILSDKVVVLISMYNTNRGIIVERPSNRSRPGGRRNFKRGGFTKKK